MNSQPTHYRKGVGFAWDVGGGPDVQVHVIAGFPLIRVSLRAVHDVKWPESKHKGGS